MLRGRICAALVGLALMGLSAPAFAAEPAEACPAFRDLDFAKLPTEAFTPEEGDWRQVWNRWSRTGPRKPWRGVTPTTWFRVTSSDGMMPRRFEREVFGRREGETWVLYGRRQNISGRPAPWSDWRRKTVSPAAAARLTALMAEPCLWAAPPYLYGELTLRDGRPALNVDGPVTLLEIHDGDRQWAGIQVSWLLGEPAELRAIALFESLGLPPYRDSSVLDHAYEPVAPAALDDPGGP